MIFWFFVCYWSNESFQRWIIIVRKYKNEDKFMEKKFVRQLHIELYLHYLDKLIQNEFF